MKAYANGRIITASENTGNDENGKEFKWNTVFVKDQDGAVIEMSSGSQNFDQFEGDTGVCEFEIRKDGPKIKVKFVGFTPNEVMSLPDKEIH